ncbi:hypothetical protein Goklo_026709, partial [Gossypium klotzschianum]|nr:hypothetical protein [Gossypium klotzschianum]
MLNDDFRIYNLLNKPMFPVTPIENKWEKPSWGMVKINFDTTVPNKKMSFGMIVRDLDGFVSGGGIIEIDTQVEWAEIKAFKESILCDINRKFGDVIFETDN